jgi:hypothetical protein
VVLSKPNVIAASVYLLAISMMKEQSVHDSLHSMDSNQWQDAFLPQDGIKPREKSPGEFKQEIKGMCFMRGCKQIGMRSSTFLVCRGIDCCAMMIEFHRRGLMQKEVLDDDMDVVSGVAGLS